MKFWISIIAFSSCASLFSWSDPTIDMNMLIEAMHTRRKNVNYYSIDINGVSFNGARPWEHRWNLIGNAYDYHNKRILDLGCSIGICPIFIHKYKQAFSVTGVELELDECWIAKKLQHAFGLDFPIHNLNLDQDNYEEILGYNYDVVLCLNLHHWVEKKDRLLRYLSHFPVVVYEGHDPEHIEISRFQGIGFKLHRIVARQDNGRSLLIFSKE